MEPIPETVKAIEELGPFAEGGNLLEELKRMGNRVNAVVPDCVGLSVASEKHGVTFTLIAPETQIELLDAIHHVAGEVDVAKTARLDDLLDDDLLDEESWRLRAMATAARGVLSTLTLPLVTDDHISGAVNLYGASRRAFTGHHEELAAILGAWAPGAVTNADLSFTTKHEAEQALRLLRAESTIDEAAHLVAEADGLGLEAARRRMRDAAQRAGITEEQLAEAVIRLRRGP
jgi:GAF domain-containing protein